MNYNREIYPVLKDDSETALEWIRVWVAVENIEGRPHTTFEDGCQAWFRMQKKNSGCQKNKIS